MSIDEKFFYTNGVEVGISPYDFSLKFMRNGSPTPETVKAAAASQALGASPAMVMETMTIAMSPVHAKAMLPILAQMIATYEQAFGTIALPPDHLAKWNAGPPDAKVSA